MIYWCVSFPFFNTITKIEMDQSVGVHYLNTGRERTFEDYWFDSYEKAKDFIKRAWFRRINALTYELEAAHAAAELWED